MWTPKSIPELPAKEFDALVHTDGRARARYFITKVIDHGWVCGWGDDDGLSMWEDSEGNETIAFWPHPAYAAACYESDSEDSRTHGPVYYRLDHLLNVSLPVLVTDRVRIGIFPVGQVFADVLTARFFGTMMDDALNGVIDIS